MTVSSDVSKIVHVYNGAVREYPYTFKVFEAGQLRVIRFEKDSPGRDLALGTEYTAGGLGGAGGGLVRLTAAGAGMFKDGDELVIMRKMTFVQETDYTPHGKFPADSHERALDILTMMCQELREMIGRALLDRENQDSGDNLVAWFVKLKEAAEAARGAAEGVRDEAAVSAEGAGQSAAVAALAADRAALAANSAGADAAAANNAAGRASAARDEAEDFAAIASLAGDEAAVKSNILTDCYCSVLRLCAAVVNCGNSLKIMGAYHG